MDRLVAAQRCASDLAAAVGDHLVDVHVELGAAPGHPDMQRKHVVVLAGEDFVAGLDDQCISPIVEPLVGMIGNGSGFFQRGVGSDHLARDQILTDAKMLKRALGLSAPQLVGGYLDLAQAVAFLAKFGH